MNWHIKTFNDLTINELYAILKLRQDVFIIEQNCIYPDIDNIDEESIHIFASYDNIIVAYCRIVYPGIKYNEPSIGRVIVDSTFRNKKIGTQLLEKAILTNEKLFPNMRNRISAQSHLQTFYQNLGFESISEIYLEDGIPHIEMLLK